jgi:hypothetical protein
MLVAHPHGKTAVSSEVSRYTFRDDDVTLWGRIDGNRGITNSPEVKSIMPPHLNSIEVKLACASQIK